MSALINISFIRQNREFALIFLGQFISFMGTMISYVVIPFQVYELTQSTMMVGLLSFFQLVPLLITALLGGVFADRYNRRKLLIYSELILFFLTIVLSINTWQNSPNLYVIYVISVFMSAINGLHRPALESLTQQILNPNDYKNAAALTSFKYSFGMIAGPAIGGLIISIHGVSTAYLIDSLSFLISLVCILLLKNLPSVTKTEHPPIISAINEGISFACSRQELLGSYVVDIIAMFFSMPNALFPAFAIKFGGATTLGLLYASPAVGSLIISSFSGWTSKIHYDGRAIAISAACCGLAMLGFGFSNQLVAAIFFLIIWGALDTISGMFRQSLWNHSIPYELRGRLAGIEMLSYIVGPKLGDLRAGSLASLMGLSATIATGGVCCFVGVSICCIFLPKFWNYKNLTP